MDSGRLKFSSLSLDCHLPPCQSFFLNPYFFLRHSKNLSFHVFSLMISLFFSGSVRPVWIRCWPALQSSPLQIWCSYHHLGSSQGKFCVFELIWILGNGGSWIQMSKWGETWHRSLFVNLEEMTVVICWKFVEFWSSTKIFELVKLFLFKFYRNVRRSDMRAS